MARDGEPEPQAPSVRLWSRVRDAERAEHIRELFGCDPLAGIAYADVDSGLSAREADLDATSTRREFNRVGHEVPDDLLQAGRVANHRARPLVQGPRQHDPLGLGRRLHRGERRLHDGRDHDSARLEV